MRVCGQLLLGTRPVPELQSLSHIMTKSMQVPRKNRQSSCAKTILIPMSLALTATLFGCASASKNGKATPAGQPPSQASVQQTSQQQVISSQKSLPETISVDSFMQQRTAHQFLAEVRTPMADETDVRLRVDGAPVEIEMQNIGGNLWRGSLTSDQLGLLASGGKVVHYQAHLIVEEPDGTVVISQDPLKFSVSAPAIENRVG